MTIESDLFAALKSLCGNRVYPDVAPIGTARPYVLYSQVGGEAVSYVEDAVPDKQNGRIQFTVWADTAASRTALITQIESAMVTAQAFQARPIGAPSKTYDHDMQLFGAMQDFSVWSSR